MQSAKNASGTVCNNIVTCGADSAEEAAASRRRYEQTARYLEPSALVRMYADAYYTAADVIRPSHPSA